MFGKARRSVTPQTIINCFVIAGFKNNYIPLGTSNIHDDKWNCTLTIILTESFYTLCGYGQHVYINRQQNFIRNHQKNINRVVRVKTKHEKRGKSYSSFK